MKQTVQEIVYDVTASDDGFKQPATWLPKNVKDFQWWLTSVEAEIPHVYRHSAEIVFEGGYADGDNTVRCVVSYRREETDEEEQKREAQEQWDKAARERAQQQDSHFIIARTIKRCSAEQKRLLLELLKKELGE